MKKQILLAALAFFFFSVEMFSQCPPPGYPPIAGDCPSAPVICQDLNGYCDVLSSINTQQSFPGCPANALNNDSWFAFIAGSSTITIEVVPSNCQNPPGSPQGMQGAIYEGDCNGPVMDSQCGCVVGTFQMSSTNFVPGQVYYIVFDGCAGDICEFQVNVISGSTLPVAPADPGPILGPTEVCPGATVDYTLNVPNGANYEWTLIPPLGTISGSPGAPISIEWGPAPGMAQLCVTASNPCGLTAGPSCITINSQPIPPETQTYDICSGDCVECAGITYCAATSPLGDQVILNSYLGCDSVIYCVINTIIIPPTDLGQETFCAPASFEVCGNIYDESGIYTETCQSYQGCDSTVTIDLAIFDPMAVITEPIPTLGCGSTATIDLDGFGSNFPAVPGAQVFFQWTGPGIIGVDDDVEVTIALPGEYCLTVTHERNGIQCSDTDCVDVIADNDVPMQPTIMGNENPCEGDVETYTVTPNGAPSPDDYTWTTPNGEPFTQTGPTSIEVTWNNPAGGELCVTANNDCGPSTPQCITIVVDGLPDDPVLDGPNTACANNQTETYTVTNAQVGQTYVWSVNNGASTIGTGSSIEVDFSGATGTVDVCVTAGNDCGDSQPECIAVDITPVALTPTLSGPTSVCSNGGNYTFEVTGPQAGVTFNWTAPAPAVITGSGSSVSIDFAGATTGQVCVSATNACGTSTDACQNVTVIQAPTAEISGSGSFCEGTVPSIDLTITLTGTGPWDVQYTLNGASPTDLTINNSPYTLTVSQAGTYELTTLTSGGTCDGSVSGSAVVTELPEPTAILSGTGNICDGSGDAAQLTIDLTGTAPWEVCWEVDGAAQAPLNIASTPYTLNVIQAQAGAITISCVTDGNDCDGMASGNAQVSIEESPSVTMISTPCDATNTEYNVIFTVNGGDPSTYQVLPNTGTWSGNEYTSGPIPSGDGYSFEVFDANGCDSVVVSDNAVICDCESMTGLMDATAIEACGPTSIDGVYDNTDQMLDGDDVLNFVLHSGNGTSIVDPIVGQYTSELGINFQDPPMSYGVTYYLSAVVGNDNGSGMTDLDDPCLAVSQGTSVTWYEEPEATIGAGSAICEGDDATIQISFTGEAPWSITYDDGVTPQTLNGITDNPYSLVVSPTATTEYCLTDVSDVHCPGSASGCAEITVNTGVSVSNIQTTCNATATAYVVTFDVSGGDPSSYFTTGDPGNIVAGVFTSDEIPANTGYNIVFDDANGCSPQTVSAPTVVCNCQTDAGTMDAMTYTYCSDGPTIDASLANGFDLDGDDILQYVLHTGASNTLGTVIATDNTSPSNFTFDDATMDYGTTYYISSVAGNDDGTGNVDPADPCYSVAPGTPVIFYEVPTATISGGQDICPGDNADLLIDLTGDSPWTITINGDVIDNITGTPYTYQVNPAVSTTYSLTMVEDENCQMVLAADQTINVHVPPTISAVGEDCNATGTAYTVTIDIVDGDPSCYAVTPATGVLTGGQFVSDEIPQGTGYNFEVTDCFGCPAEIASEPFIDCNCNTDAGTMNIPPNTIDFCLDQTADVDYNGGQILEPDDVLVFIMHTDMGASLGTIIAVNDTEDFIFDPATMATETVYYISAVAGDDDGSGTMVDVGDNCLSVAPGVPVIFHELPTISIVGNSTICEGQTADITISMTGAAPFSVTYLENGTLITDNSLPADYTISVGVTTTIELVSVEDANTCGNTSSESVIVTVNPNVSAGMPTGDLEFCESDPAVVDLNSLLTGADPGGTWTGPTGTISGGSLSVASLAPGTGTYTYTVNGIAPCPDDDASVDITVQPTPTADAGADQSLSCDVDELTVGGANTTPGLTYEWTDAAGDVISNDMTFSTTTPGTFTLNVSNALGCSASDEVTIGQNADEPEVFYTENPVQCFGDENGYISIDSVAGGLPPYLVSFEGGPFLSELSFLNLAPGEYNLVIEDNAGCQKSILAIIEEPTEVDVEIVGDFGINDPIISLGESTDLDVFSNPPASQLDTIMWSTGETTPTITVQPVQQTTYSVTIEENGCRDDASLTLFVSKDRPVFIPNAFSPNDDGINDVFTIYAGQSVASVRSFIVFSRWGESVFEFYNFDPKSQIVGWDGRLRGNDLNPAVFTYFAEIEFIDGSVELYEGDVNLVK